LRQAILSCRSGGVVSVIGVYGGLPLLQHIERGELDPTRIITHTLPLEEAGRGFEMFKNKRTTARRRPQTLTGTLPSAVRPLPRVTAGMSVTPLGFSPARGLNLAPVRA
jgi:hypothetical protein